MRLKKAKFKYIIEWMLKQFMKAKNSLMNNLFI